jgi:hypothetical protein
MKYTLFHSSGAEKRTFVQVWIYALNATLSAAQRAQITEYVTDSK